jgi:hypothetical protein
MLVAGVAVSAVIVCVIMHYEALRLISDLLPTRRHRHRRRIVYLILGLLFVHVAEIWVFGLAYYGLLQADSFGQLAGMDPVTLFDCIYYSAIVFTTLGFGDIVPHGHIRFLTGMEAIAGLTFITWSASFTFFEMTKNWDDARKDDR